MCIRDSNCIVLPVFVVVLEKFLAGDIPALLYYAGKPPAVDANFMRNTFLSFKGKANITALYLYMFIMQSGKPMCCLLYTSRCV